MVNTSPKQTLFRALHLPRTHRWVTEWLFSNPLTTFHPHVIIPPLAFESALSFQCRSNMTLPELPAVDIKADFNTICVPVAMLDGILIGYSLGLSANPYRGPSTSEDPFEPPWCARFVFDTASKQMLHIALDGIRRDIGVHLMDFAVDTCTTQISCNVPLGEYTFQQLPDTVLAASHFVSVEHRVDKSEQVALVHKYVQGLSHLRLEFGQMQSLAAQNTETPAPTAAGKEVNLFDYIDIMLDAKSKDDLLDLPTLNPSMKASRRSHLPLQNLIDNTSMYGATTCLDMNANIKSGHCTSLDHALAMLFNLCVGTFTARTVFSDSLSVTTGHDNPLHACNFARTTFFASEHEIGALRHAFSSTYFLQVLSVAPDQRLHIEGADAWANDRAIEKVVNEIDAGWNSSPAEGVVAFDRDAAEAEDRSSLRQVRDKGEFAEREADGFDISTDVKEAATTGPVPIAPAYKPDSQVVEALPSETHEERRLRIATLRKRRNRESAQRSNVRRKEKTEAIRKEIAENKERAKVLQELQDVLIWEREKLRQIAAKADIRK